MVAMMPVGASRREIMPADSRRRVTVATAAAAEDMPGSKAAAAMDGAAPEAAASVKDSAATFEATASTAASKTATTAAMTAVATMAAFDFDRRGVGDVFRCRRSAGIDQRKRLSMLAWQGQRQYRGSRKAPATDKAAPGIWNPDHL
jgi:hypothetical protein